MFFHQTNCWPSNEDIRDREHTNIPVSPQLRFVFFLIRCFTCFFNFAKKKTKEKSLQEKEKVGVPSLTDEHEKKQCLMSLVKTSRTPQIIVELS